MKTKTKILVALLTILTVFALVFVGAFFIYKGTLTPVEEKIEGVDPEEVVFTILDGERAKIVAQHLEDEGLVSNALTSYIYTRINHMTDVKVGSYALNRTMSVAEIFKILNDPKGAISDEVLITIPEGKWASEIALIISNKTDCAKIDLENLWNDPEYIKSIMEKYPFLKENVLQDDLRIKLEGYLFPETYYIRKSANAKTITKILLDQTQKIYEKYQEDIEKSSMSFHEILTLASIVQYESGMDSDNAAIAQVFLNRINNPEFETGGYLQSNVTAQYAWGSRMVNCEFDENKTIDSPFNTYVVKGLPIGPVCCPGEAAIEAVLHPDTNYLDYYYFLADRKGVVHYAKTFKEHQENDRRY